MTDDNTKGRFADRLAATPSRSVTPPTGSMFGLVVRFRFAVIALVAILTAAFAWQLPNLRLDPDTEAYIPKGHPIRVFWKQAKEDFAVGKDIFVGIVADGPRGVFTPEILSGIAELTEGIKQLDAVVADDVRSLSNSDAIVGTESGLDIEPFYQEPPSTPEQAAEIREKVFRNDVYLDRLISRDGSIAAIIVQAHDAYDDKSPYAHPVETYRQVVEYVGHQQIPGTTMVVAGNTAVEAAFGRQMAADLKNLIPTALMVVVVTLFLCFRSTSWWRFIARTAGVFLVLSAWGWWHSAATPSPYLAMTAATLAMLTVRGVLLPCTVVVVSLVWTWGAQAMLDMPIYISGTLVPPILLAIGCADGIHIIERYLEEAASRRNRAEAIVASLGALWRPVVFTSVTTAIGFGALMLGRMTVYQVFGFTAAFGILVAMLMSLVLLPAMLAVMPLPPPVARGVHASMVPVLLGRLGARIQRRRKPTLAVGLTLTLLLLAGAAKLKVDYSWVESLTPGSRVLQADRLLRTRHGGTMPMNIVVDSQRTDGIKDPDLLRGIDAVLSDLSANPSVGDTRSIAEYIKRMNEAMHANRAGTLRIPDSRELIAQYLLLYSMSGDPGELDDMVDYDYRRAQMGVLLRTDLLSKMDEVILLTEASLDKHVRSLGADAVITGSAMIQNTVFDLILTSQVYSLTTAVLLVALFMVVLFRSILDALICMLPSLFAGIANFGGMALLGIPLGPAEAMVSAIALGIGIDYSIHLMSRMRELTEQKMGITEATVEAMRTTGRAILFNGFVVVAGFTVLALSSTPSNATFGLEVAINMGLTCIAALVLLPAALAVRAEFALPEAAVQTASTSTVAPRGPKFGAPYNPR